MDDIVTVAAPNSSLKPAGHYFTVVVGLSTGPPPEFHKLRYSTVRPLSTVGYTSVVANVIRSRQWSNYLNS